MVTRKEVNETKKKDEKRGGRKNVNSFESKKKKTRRIVAHTPVMMSV